MCSARNKLSIAPTSSVYDDRGVQGCPFESRGALWFCLTLCSLSHSFESMQRLCDKYNRAIDSIHQLVRICVCIELP